MFESIYGRLSVFIVMITALLIGNTQASGTSLEFAPAFGVSSQIGSSSDEWRMGYSVGLDGMIYQSGAIRYGFRLGYQYAIPDAKAMLQIDDNDVQIERKEGSRYIAEVSLIGRYDIPELRDKPVGMSIIGGVGMNFIETSSIRLKGFSPKYKTAVNREIHRDPDARFAPSVSLGIDFTIAKQVRPTIGYQHIFMSENGSTGLLMVSLGLLARR